MNAKPLIDELLHNGREKLDLLPNLLADVGLANDLKKITFPLPNLGAAPNWDAVGYFLAMSNWGRATLLVSNRDQHDFWRLLEQARNKWTEYVVPSNEHKLIVREIWRHRG